MKGVHISEFLHSYSPLSVYMKDTEYKAITGQK